MTKNISREIIVNYTPDEMYNLVSDFPQYKNFLPWCANSRVLSSGTNYIVGRIDISYMIVKIHYTTKNTSYNKDKIEMQLVDGPFKNMHGYWEFIPHLDSGCKLRFKLVYQFENFIVEKVIGKVFNMVISSIIDSFMLEAAKRYGKR